MIVFGNEPQQAIWWLKNIVNILKSLNQPDNFVQKRLTGRYRSDLSRSIGLHGKPVGIIRFVVELRWWGNIVVAICASFSLMYALWQLTCCLGWCMVGYVFFDIQESCGSFVLEKRVYLMFAKALIHYVPAWRFADCATATHIASLRFSQSILQRNGGLQAIVWWYMMQGASRLSVHASYIYYISYTYPEEAGC